jgi:hypothetical protein
MFLTQDQFTIMQKRTWFHMVPVPSIEKSAMHQMHQDQMLEALAAWKHLEPLLHFASEPHGSLPSGHLARTVRLREALLAPWGTRDISWKLMVDVMAIYGCFLGK